jgi:hypothetical protein
MTPATHLSRENRNAKPNAAKNIGHENTTCLNSGIKSPELNANSNTPAAKKINPKMIELILILFRLILIKI